MVALKYDEVAKESTLFKVVKSLDNFLKLMN